LAEKDVGKIAYKEKNSHLKIRRFKDAQYGE
jgi:hypothetical protein